jgi:cation:H+ antiporter
MLLNSSLFFLFGLAGLWLGSELLIRSSLAISRKLKISETIIGLTILSIGTSLPEIVLAITGAIEQGAGKDTSSIIVGSVLGSAMSQIALVLGIAGLIKVLRVNKKDTIRNGFFLIIATLLFFVLTLDGLISATDGLIFLGFYLFYFFSLQRSSHKSASHKHIKISKRGYILSSLSLLFGLVIMAVSSYVVVEHSTLISDYLGISHMLIGILLVGLGTSLPEMMVSLNAVLKGSAGLSVGNVIGSNIVDMLVALGASATISGWRIDPSISSFDLPFLLLTTVIVIFFLLTKQKLERKESFLMICLYVFYILLKFNGV